jgi:hypothetical protein
MEQEESAVVAEYAGGKCPYLAGRPPHGTYKLWPSSINVCYARASEEKSYGHVGKETQGGRCFAGESAYCECSDYQRVITIGLAPPEFGQAIKEVAAVPDDSPVKRVRKRRRKKRRSSPAVAAIVRSFAFAALLVITVVVVIQVLTKGP